MGKVYYAADHDELVIIHSVLDNYYIENEKYPERVTHADLIDWFLDQNHFYICEL